MLKLLISFFVYITVGGGNAVLLTRKGSLVGEWISTSPVTSYGVFLRDSVNGNGPYHSRSRQLKQHSLAFRAPSYGLVKVFETQVKYPNAVVIGQVPISSTYGNPAPLNLPTVSSSYSPQIPTPNYGPATGVARPTAPGGIEYGIGPLSTSYSNFLGTPSTGNYYGSSTASNTAPAGLAGTAPTATVTTNPTGGTTGSYGTSVTSLGTGSGGTSGIIGGSGINSLIPPTTLPAGSVGNQNGLGGTSGAVINPGLYVVGTPSRPAVNAGPATITIPVTIPLASLTGYQQQTLQGNLGSNECPSSVLKPGTTCLQVGPQPVSAVPGNNNIQSSTNSGLNPNTQVTNVPSNGTLLGYGTTVTSLGTGGGGTSGIVGSSGINSLVPPTTLPAGSVGNQNGLGGSSGIVTNPGLYVVGTPSRPVVSAGPATVTGLGTGSGGTSGIVGGLGINSVTPSTTLPAGSAGNQNGLGGTSGVVTSPGVGTPSRPVVSTVTSLGGTGGVLGSSGINSLIPPTTLPTGSVTSVGSNNGVTNGTIGFIPPTTSPLITTGGQSGLIGSTVYLSGAVTNGTASAIPLGSTGTISLIPQTAPLTGPVGATQSGLQTGTQPVSGLQTVVCVTPELCNQYISQPAATVSGLLSIPADGVLCNPSGCHQVSKPVSEDYYANVSAHKLGKSVNATAPLAKQDDTKTVSGSTNI